MLDVERHEEIILGVEKCGNLSMLSIEIEPLV